jgi:tetratricopeptide (TPR) repeat protein
VPVIKGLTDALFLQPKGWFKFLKRPRPTQPIPPAKWNATLKRLQDLRLLEHDPDTGRLDAHPLLREYFAATLSKNQPEAWQEGHRRLYQQLKDSVPHHPEGLTGLQALYQAVVHGCRAGLYQEALNEVYISRILRGTGSDGFYSAKKLGAFGADLGAVACFFTEPWQRLAPGLPVGDQAWLLNEAATRLRALGRLAEALEPMWVGAESAEAQADWKNAAIYYGNLSLLQLSLGRIVLAVADAERAVDYADRSGDAFQRISKRTALADARHQQGEWEAARRGFAEAEAMQAERKLEYLQLYSRPGFRYGELLLTEAERAAWGGPAAAEGSEGCAQVAQRAAQALPIAMRNNHLLSIALAQLTLARSALYTDLLHGRTPGEDAQQHTEAAVAGLHRAGDQDELPLGLLTRAWLRHGLNNTDGAQADLAEAQRIAERGGMKLHLADIALTRARLFEDKAELAKARALIEACGYGRRLPELEDAEQRLRLTQ